MSIKIPGSSNEPLNIGRRSPYESKDGNPIGHKDAKNKKHKLKGHPKYEKLSQIAKEKMSPPDNENKTERPKTAEEKPISVAPKLSSALKSDIKDYAKLFQSSRDLTNATKDHPLSPKKGEHANEVYLAKPTKENEGVVFKTNPAAEKAVTCAGLARLVGLGLSPPPAKIGAAGVSVNLQYMRLSVKGDSDILVDPEAAEKIDDLHTESGVLSCSTDAVQLKLIPSGKYYKAEIQKEEPLSPLETAIKDGKSFVSLTDEEDMSFLAPETAIFEIKTSKEKEYVTIKDFTYLVKMEEDGSATLTIPKIKQKSGAVPDDALLEEGIMVRLNRQDPEDDENLTEVLSLSNSVVSVDLEVSEDHISFIHDGKDYEVQKLDSGDYSITESLSETHSDEDSDDEVSFDEQGRQILSAHERQGLGEDDFPFDENEELILCQDAKGNSYLASKEDSLAIKSDAKGESVVFNSENYSPVATNSGKFEIVGKSVKGMIQPLVTNTFTHSKDGKNLNITIPSPERDAFFKRIDMPSFIDSFILTILIRPQDGKVIDLEQSNVLFQAIGSDDPLDPNVKLKPVLIDLDETLPKKNGYSLDPQFTDDGLKKVHSVRCGLMGFPQARAKLDDKDKERVLDHLNKIVNSREQIRQYLSKSGRNHIDSVESTMEIVDNIQKFLTLSERNQNDWTLEDILFDVIPGYKNQWTMLGNMDPAVKASRIGLESEETLQPNEKGSSKNGKSEPLKMHLPKTE